MKTGYNALIEIWLVPILQNGYPKFGTDDLACRHPQYLVSANLMEVMPFNPTEEPVPQYGAFVLWVFVQKGGYKGEKVMACSLSFREYA